MSKLEVPLLGKAVWATGDMLLRAELDILVKTRIGSWESLVFRADSGSEMTSIPSARAKSLDLPLPQSAVPGLSHTQTGKDVRSGLITVRLIGLEGAEFVFPCYFLGDPDGVPPEDESTPAAQNLLGLTGVVNQIRICFDGSSRPTAVGCSDSWTSVASPSRGAGRRCSRRYRQGTLSPRTPTQCAAR